MRFRTRIAALVPVALLVLGLGTAAAVTAAPEAAQAQSGYRVCVVFHTSTKVPYGFGAGVATKIWKGDKSNTCGRKIDFINAHIGEVSYSTQGTKSTRMITCEDFKFRIGAPFGWHDPCLIMETNGLYAFTSMYDDRYPHPPVLVRWYPRS